MSILTGILQFVLVIVCIMLVGVILLQRNKGAGAGVTFGGGEAVFGADMGNVLTRSTIVLGVLFLSITIALSIINAHIRTAGTGSVTDGVAKPAAQTLPAPEAAPVAAEEPAVADAALAEEAADETADAAAPAEAADMAEEKAEEAAPAVEAPAEPAPAVEAPAEAAPAPAAEPAPAADKE